MIVSAASGTATDALLARVVRHPPTGRTALPAPPRLRVAVVACMDARLMVEDLLALEAGDAHIIRNAGGIVTDDVIRSLAISQRQLGTREVVVIRHTDCGLLGFDDEALHRELVAETGSVPTWRAGGFTDVARGLASDLRTLSQDPYLRHTDRIRGFVYDVSTGGLEEISEPSR